MVKISQTNPKRRGAVALSLGFLLAALAVPATTQAQGRSARVFFVTFEGLGSDVPEVAVSSINRSLVDRFESFAMLFMAAVFLGQWRGGGVSSVDRPRRTWQRLIRSI